MKTLIRYRHLALSAALIASVGASWAQVPLANQPVLSQAAVPGNLALALSVEFPTAVSVAHIGTTYSSATEYLGYFDPNKCYLYNFSATEANRHFYPTSVTATRTCNGASGQWSGNFLNWATMQTIDPFRWALTGGYRVVDTPGSDTTAGVTILEKAWASGQGGTGNFPNRSLTANTAQSTPSTVAPFRMRVQGLGNKLRFTRTGNVDNAPTAYNPAVAMVAGTTYEVSIRVKVCDATVGLEANCVGYGAPPAVVTYKPEGLMQKYSDRIRYSAFGYLNDSSITRDGGVLRARQAFIGPSQPVPGLPAIANKAPEWDGGTGVMLANPLAGCTAPPCPPNDAALAAAAFGVPVINSGVMNYLNKFGQSGTYKTFDPVGELYYAAVRYFKNLGNVPAWSNMNPPAAPGLNAQYVDGFPVITTWDDPILYSCQKNFILGIGDVNTHADKNVAGSSIASGANEPGAPSFSPDPLNATNMTNKVGSLEGLGASLGTANPYGGCCNNNSALMAGVAYDSHTRDIRPDVATNEKTLGKQTIDTYWLDVLEFSNYKNNNQFYLAAKYGGFQVPPGFDPDSATAALPGINSWYNSTRVSPNATAQPLPDNYFVASDPKSMVNGLTQAFTKIASSIEQVTTSAATSQPQVLSTGSVSYSASYRAKDWTGEVKASQRLFGTSATPVDFWSFSAKLAAQAPSSRVMATWNGSAGIPFDLSNLTAAGYAGAGKPLDTPWIDGDDSPAFVNYLRGDQTNEITSPGYRKREKLVGDIVDSTLVAVRGAPFRYTNFFNPGYETFKTSVANRKTVLYVGTNAGVLHAINGAPCTSAGAAGCASAAPANIDVNAGKEIFAYVPSALFAGPSSPPTPEVDGLAALGSGTYVHRNFVNASPDYFDVDLANTVAGKGGACAAPSPATPGSPNWRTVLIGGLGKGGRSYYALDITDPIPSTTLDESALAAKVMWEFPRATDVTKHGLNEKLGFSFGTPVVVKTAEHGWVAIFTSGYNNADGKGYFFIVDVCSGEMVEPPISTGVGAPGLAEAGMAHPTALVLDFRDGLADAAYAGDLYGNVWRLDLRAQATPTTPLPAPERIAVLRDAFGAVQQVTSRPLVEICPKTGERFVMVGTGRLLDSVDIGITQKQHYYAFKDGNDAVFDTLLTTATSVVRADLVDVSDSLTGPATVFTNGKGWYIEVGKNQPEAGVGWRVVTPSTFFNGSVIFAASYPDSSDACTSKGAGLFYGVGICDAKSLLQLVGSGLTLVNQRIDANPTQSGTTVVNADGNPVIPESTSTSGTAGLKPEGPTAERRLNWREINITQ
jgi:type IV pilus assembly protein PilY1